MYFEKISSYDGGGDMHPCPPGYATEDRTEMNALLNFGVTKKSQFDVTVE